MRKIVQLSFDFQPRQRTKDPSIEPWPVNYLGRRFGLNRAHARLYAAEIFGANGEGWNG